MRTIKPPQTRKEEILEGALTVFLQKGYDKTTIADIAGALGISQGLCYRYFSSKEEIYDAVIDAYAAAIVRENQNHRSQNQPIRQWVEDIGKLLGTMEQAEGLLPRQYALFHDPKNKKMHGELCLRVGEKLLPVVTAVLEQAQAAGELRLADCRATARFGVYGEIGLLMQADTRCSDAIRDNWLMLLGLNGQEER